MGFHTQDMCNVALPRNINPGAIRGFIRICILDIAGYRQSFRGWMTSADCQANAHQTVGYIIIIIDCHYPQLLRGASRIFAVFGLISKCMSDTADGETVANQGIRIRPDSVY